MGKQANDLRRKIDALGWAVKRASDDYMEIDSEKSTILYSVWEICERILTDDHETAGELWDAIDPEWFKA